MGFLMGEVTNWSFVRRDLKNNQEIRWKKKCSTHHRQVSLREEIIAIIENEVIRKAANKGLKLQNAIDDNIKCEKQILNLMIDKGIEELNIKNTTLEWFHKHNND